MADQTPQHERVWDIIETVGVCMLTTRFDGGLARAAAGGAARS